MRRNLAAAGGIFVANVLVLVASTCALAPSDRPATAPPVAGVTQLPPTSTAAPTPTVLPAAATPLVSPSPATVASPAAEWWRRTNQPDPVLASQAEAAYRRYWEIVTDAELNLDSRQLANVMSGNELAREQRLIDDLRQQGRAARTDVEHASQVVFAEGGEAVIYDEHVNRTVLVDASTKEPLPGDRTPTTWKVSYLLRKSGGTWKVVDGVRHP